MERPPDISATDDWLSNSEVLSVPFPHSTYVRKLRDTHRLRRVLLLALGVMLFPTTVEGLGPDTSLRVELLDRFERPLSSYSGQHLALVEQSGLRFPVSWKGTDLIWNLRESFNIEASFNGTLNGAITFYALYVEGSE